MTLILFASLALPWSLVLQMAFWLAGATLLWIGGRFLARLPRATFGQSVLTYLLIGITGFVIFNACAIIAWQVGPSRDSIVVLMKLTYILLALLASYLIIKILFRASWPKAILAWLPTLVILAASIGIRLGSTWEPVKIELSYETTRVLGPLNDDGTVNYLAALNEQYSKGVTAENNAAILLLRAAGPKFFPAVIKDKALAILGLSSLPSEGDYFVRFDTYVGDSEEAYEFPEEAIEGPWSAKDYPKLAGWLKANEKPLSLVISATNRPRYYMPMLSPDEPPHLLSGLVPGVHIQREMSRALVTRAMLKLDSDDIDGARADLLAVHRLARLVGQGPTLIERLVGMAVESQACKGDNSLAISGQLSSSQARAYLATLQGLPALPGIAESIDKGGRFSGLAGAMLCRREGFEALSSLLGRAKKEKNRYLRPKQFEWNEVLRIVNSRFDRLVEAAGKETFRERQEAFERISAERKETTANIRKSQALEPPKTTEEMGDLLVSLLIPSLERVSAQHDVAIMRMRASQVAMALTAYRAELGSYPEILAELCPKYFKAVPEDLFTAKPVDYRRVKNGYMLYSPGPTVDEKFPGRPLEIEITADK